MLEIKPPFKITVKQRRDRIFGKPVKGFVARIGTTEWKAEGDTKEKALENLETLLVKTEEHQADRVYRFKGDTVFCFYWCRGSWCYDIMSPHYKHPSHCAYSPDFGRERALKAMDEHIANYERETPSGTAQTPGESSVAR